MPVSRLAGARGPLAVLVLAGLGALAGCRDEPAVERPDFDGAAALGYVERQVALGPRVPNTEAHRRAREMFVEHLRARADTVRVEEFEHVVLQGDTLRLANVLASFAPEARSRILVTAHWDTRPVAEKDPDPARRDEPIPGANDGASGAAVLLELADVLSRHPPPQGYGVDLLLLDGEDYGYEPETFATRAEDMYLGAKAFAEAHPDYRPLFGILLDLVGDADPLFLQEAYSLEYAPEVVSRVWAAARELGHEEYFEERPLGYITDDHLFLNQAGIRTIDVIDFDYPAWHTHADTLDKVSASTLDMVGEVLLEIIYGI